jgi:hypothetical protein
MPPWRDCVIGSIGIWLAAASAAAINHLLDQRIDKVMARTARPSAGHRHAAPRRCWRSRSRSARLSMAILLLAGQCDHRSADVRIADRLRLRLHRLPQARHAAEHRDRRHRRRRAAAAGLGRGDGHAESVRLGNTRCCWC